MASFSAGTTFTDGVANDVTAAKLGALVNNATPTSGLIQDRTAETVTATNDTLLIGDASDSNNLKRITVANFAQTLPTAKVTTGTIDTATLGTTTGTAATFTTGTITTLTAGTTTSTAATITTGTIPTLVATTLVTTGAGTASAPAIVPTGDTNTGIFFPAADTIAFSEGGTESMRIDSSGRIGIGTSSPSESLEVAGSAPKIKISATSNSSVQLLFNSNLSGVQKDTGSIYYLNNEAMTFQTQGTERLRIDSSGNVGIGTTSPAAKLTVSGTNGTNSELRVVSTGANTGGRVTLYENTSGCWEFATSAGANSSLTVKDLFNNTERLRIDSSGNVGIGTTSPTNNIGWTTLALNSSTNGGLLELQKNGTRTFLLFNPSGSSDTTIQAETSNNLRLGAGGTERLRITSGGNVLVGKTQESTTVTGVFINTVGKGTFTSDADSSLFANRLTNDGTLVELLQANTLEGTISVSGTTVSYNGGHLSRFSQLPSGQRDPAIKKGTVLSNLDEMCVWNDAEGNPMPNEQLNKVKISDVEGDNNVAGVFVNWDNDDQDNPFDMNMAMTGDMIIRIAQGVTVSRGDLLMSAGDGTAKPQGDDTRKAKTIAKVTSTNVTCTYEDGSYCVPCVLMAC